MPGSCSTGAIDDRCWPLPRRVAVLLSRTSWSWGEFVRSARVRAAVLADAARPEPAAARRRAAGQRRRSSRSCSAAPALGGHVVVGPQPTRRGEALAADVRRPTCQVVCHRRAHAACSRASTSPRRLVRSTPRTGRRSLDEHAAAPVPDVAVGPDDLLMLIFTSGTTGDPKAVNVTQAKVAYPGQFLSERFGLGPEDVALPVDADVPLQRVMAGWGPALAAGATMALAATFSASRLPARRTPLRRDVRQLRRQAADLRHGDARAARRRRQPAAAGLRQRGQRPRHRGVRRGASAAWSSTPSARPRTP